MRARGGRITQALVCLTLFVGGGITISCGVDEVAPPPTITAQGFDLVETRAFVLGEPAALRLRIEAPSGLESVLVRERSYEVDLARSPEASHFPLFGLSRRVWSKPDVTLDFGPYIATKLGMPGDYTFEIVVTDRREQKAEATLSVVVSSDPDEAEPATPAPEAESAEPVAPTAVRRTPMRTREFRLERVGRGPVQSGEDLGITWKTIDGVLVVVRLSGRLGEESRFARLQADAFSGIDSHEKLAEVVSASATQSSLELTTANDAAAGAVFAILQPSQSYLVRADHSETSLSDLGTTVTLTGRFKD